MLASQTELLDFNQRNRFFNNLNQKIKAIVAGYPKQRKESLEALIDAASKAKDSLRSIGGWKDGWRKPQYQPSQGTAANPISINAASPSFTPSPTFSRPPRDKSTVQCYNCQEFGHFASTCTNPRKPRQQAPPVPPRNPARIQASSATPAATTLSSHTDGASANNITTQDLQQMIEDQAMAMAALKDQMGFC
jgi:hypothetical protein